MKRVSTPVLLAFAVFLASPAALAFDHVTVEGGGWGHGIGMPQYGARALAESGRTGEQIIQYYYSGTQFGTVGQGNVVGHADPLRIGVAPSSTSQRFWAVGGSLTLCLDGNPCTVAQPGEVWRIVVVDNNACRFFKDGVAQGQPGACRGEITWGNQPNVRVHFPDIPNTGRTYARGKVVFVPVPNNSLRYHLLVEIGLEPYLFGLGEMPSSWHMEALRAQAMAARAYAVSRAWVYRNLSSNSARMIQCACHLMGTTQDQVYVGWAKEAESLGHRWVSAVNSTARKVPIHSHSDGRAISAFYYSASGGRTENNEDVWGGSAVPYLRSVSDPGARSWAAFGDSAKTFTKADFASRLGFSAVWDTNITSRFVSGSPRSVVVTGIKNGVTTSQSFTGNQLRQLLGLRSHFITGIAGFDPITDFFSGDFTGDGTDEVAVFAGGRIWVFNYSGGKMVGSEWATVTGQWRTKLAGDFNGDGKTDLALFSASGVWWVGTSTGSGFSFSRWTPAFSPTTGWIQLVGDFNGDGRDDIANYHPSNGTWWVSRSTGTSFVTTKWSADFSPRTGWVHLVGDFNGDGRDDIANYYAGNGTWWVSRSTGSGFVTTRWSAGFSPRTGWVQLVGDFNGDGRDDIANYYAGNGTWWVSRSTGSGFVTTRWAAGFSPRSGWSPQLVGDFNGDGKADIASFHSSNGTWWVSRSTGTSFVTSLKGQVSPGSGWTAQVVGDFTGDGKDDISNFFPGNGVWAIR